MDEFKKLNKQPLKFVLAEFRFSPVLKIAEYIPSIQEALRKQYPIPDKKSEQAIEVQPNGIAVSTSERWSFVSGDKKNAVEITQERLIYCTSAYPRFKGFSAACKQALTVISQVVDPSLILRIGLRYGDLIIVDGNEQIQDLIDPHFAFPECVSSLGKNLHQRGESFISTDSGVLAIRTFYGVHNLSYLSDMVGLPVNIQNDETPSERMILDFDHFWESRDDPISFEVGDILKKLDRLHTASKKAFEKITTDYARNKKWA